MPIQSIIGNETPKTKTKKNKKNLQVPPLPDPEEAKKN
jgi:hypothetical protein